MIHATLLLFISLSALAVPKEIEVWFVSNAKTSYLQEVLNTPNFLFRPLTAELQCQEMGEYCFDPQHGLYKKNDLNGEVVETKNILKEGPSIPTAKSVERDLINCESGNYFDIFCGKSKPLQRVKPNLEVWIDTSSSMKEFDYTDKQGGCYRKSFLKNLDDNCGFNQKVGVMYFDTSLKEAGSIEQSCINQGLNDYKRLMDWILRSEAKKLVVITDLYEFHKEFSDFIEKNNGKLVGDKDPLTAKQMFELSEELSKSCK